MFDKKLERDFVIGIGGWLLLLVVVVVRRSLLFRLEGVDVVGDPFVGFAASIEASLAVVVPSHQVQTEEVNEFWQIQVGNIGHG
jgi:hypothetical protein